MAGVTPGQTARPLALSLAPRPRYPGRVAKKEKPFNNPFGGLKLPAKGPAPRKAAPMAAPPPRPRTSSEEEEWLLAVDGAQPLLDRSATIRPSKAPPLARPVDPLDPDLAAYDELRALVDGELPFDLSDSDEFIEGSTRGLDPRVLRRLKRGDFSVQGHLDLHGMVKDAAKAELEAFLTTARAEGRRCVLVVHGRGLHSKDQVPVLKDALKRWMGAGRLSRDVLAFATARPHDGGAGAVYVLLRRRDAR
jgi:DNA-nicking Smr family endonuclease